MKFILLFCVLIRVADAAPITFKTVRLKLRPTYLGHIFDVEGHPSGIRTLQHTPFKKNRTFTLQNEDGDEQAHALQNRIEGNISLKTPTGDPIAEFSERKVGGVVHFSMTNHLSHTQIKGIEKVNDYNQRAYYLFYHQNELIAEVTENPTGWIVSSSDQIPLEMMMAFAGFKSREHSLLVARNYTIAVVGVAALFGLGWYASYQWKKDPEAHFDRHIFHNPEVFEGPVSYFVRIGKNRINGTIPTLECLVEEKMNPDGSYRLVISRKESHITTFFGKFLSQLSYSRSDFRFVELETSPEDGQKVKAAFESNPAKVIGELVASYYLQQENYISKPEYLTGLHQELENHFVGTDPEYGMPPDDLADMIVGYLPNGPDDDLIDLSDSATFTQEYNREN